MGRHCDLDQGARRPRAQQLGPLASLPTWVVAALVAFGAIPPTLGLGLVLGTVRLVLDVPGWHLSSARFDRERLITGTR